MEGKWLSVLEYASYKKKSISTVRRYIKANRVKHKEESGKYFIYVKSFQNDYSKKNNDLERELLALRLENQRLRKENQKIIEELNENKMLINIYEESPKIPELPQEHS
jgi:predicted transcriptional regulator